MEKLLGVLFCGGRGTRLGEITKYISKSFIPIYNKPVFKYGLELLENSKFIDEIIILSNDENNIILKQTGYKTIIQDDNVVFDMFSGWEFIKSKTSTKKHGVLMPSDNVSNVKVDMLIEEFYASNVDIIFSLFEIKDIGKLKEMGTYDIQERKFYYKNHNPISNYGVIAPYIVRNSIDTSKGDNIFNDYNTKYLIHNGYWFDIGDYDSIIDTNFFIKTYQEREK